METKSDIQKTGLKLGRNLGEVKSFFEEFGVHILLEVTLVGIVDKFLKNSVLSMLVSICIVEGSQLFFRKWLGDRED